MKIEKLKYLVIAIGVVSSVVFYAFNGGLIGESDAAEIVFDDTQSAGSISSQGSEAEDAESTDGGEKGDAGSESVQALDTDSREDLKAIFKEAMEEEVTQIVRDAVRDELTSMCEAGYLEQAMQEASVYAIEEAKENEGKVNINTADVDELQSLSGIGPSKAQAIIDYREQNGAFTTPEDIMNVSGISQGTYDKFKDKIYV